MIEADLVKILIIPASILAIAQIHQRLLEVLEQKVLLHLLATQILQARKILARKLESNKAFRDRRGHHRVQLVLIIVNPAFIPNGQVAERNAHKNTVFKKCQSTIVAVEQTPDSNRPALIKRIAVRMRLVIVPNEAFIGQTPAKPITADQINVPVRV